MQNAAVSTRGLIAVIEAMLIDYLVQKTYHAQISLNCSVPCVEILR